jgi:hypothetical protein
MYICLHKYIQIASPVQSMLLNVEIMGSKDTFHHSRIFLMLGRWQSGVRSRVHHDRYSDPALHYDSVGSGNQGSTENS